MSSTGPPHCESLAARRAREAAVAAIKALRFTSCLCGTCDYTELSNNLPNRPIAFFNQMERAAIVLEFHCLIIEAHLVHDCRVNVAAVMPVLYSFIASLIGRAMYRPALDAAA